MKQFLKQSEFIIFLLLTYLLSWWSVPILNGAIIPQGPMFAAVILIALVKGRSGLREYWKGLSNWRGGRWYVIGPLVIIVYSGIALLINLMLGATLVEIPHWLSLGVFVQLLCFGGQWEEPGWMGYAFPKLHERFGSFWTAALILGVFRALWHLPLFLFGNMYWFDIFVFSFGFQLIIAWLYQNSGKSILVVMLFHFTSNLLGSILSPIFVGPERLMFYALFMSLAVLFAVGVVFLSQLKFGSRHMLTKKELQ